MFSVCNHRSTCIVRRECQSPSPRATVGPMNCLLRLLRVLHNRLALVFFGDLLLGMLIFHKIAGRDCFASLGIYSSVRPCCLSVVIYLFVSSAAVDAQSIHR